MANDGGNPIARHGGLGYLQIPTRDPEAMARFYEALVGWSIDRPAPGDIRFSDGEGLLIGRFDRAVAPSAAGGFLPYFYVRSVADAVASATSHGGAIVEAARREGDTTIARLRDPSGNVLGVWQFGG